MWAWRLMGEWRIHGVAGWKAKVGGVDQFIAGPYGHRHAVSTAAKVVCAAHACRKGIGGLARVKVRFNIGIAPTSYTTGVHAAHGMAIRRHGRIEIIVVLARHGRRCSGFGAMKAFLSGTSPRWWS